MRSNASLLVLSFVLLACVACATACDDKSKASAPDAAAPITSAAATPSASASAADAPPSKPTGKTVDTPAGLAMEIGDEVRMAGKTLYPPADCAPDAKDGCAKVKALRASMDGVKILRHFDGPGGAKSILLLQATTTGNACNGGPLFFIRVSASAPPQYSDVFDHCGGPDPNVGLLADKVVLSVAAHPPNKGTGTIPAKSAEYDIATGTLKAATPGAPKKK